MITRPTGGPITPGRVWIIDAKIEHLPGTYGGDGAHVGIDELSDLLAQHVGKWVRVRVELIDAPSPSVDDDLEKTGQRTKEKR